ncbi:MAG: Tat pathway signal protein [Actinomycetia bacterium]|nr:Tat pathway signal protein [Actinomycetes bacterium]
MSGLWWSVRLLVRRLRVSLLVWLTTLWALVAMTPTSYQDVYPSLADRALLVEAMRSSPGMRVPYGVMPTPGTIGQLLQWETGTYLVWCAALIGILITTRLLRGDEDDGLVETARGAGAGRWAGFWAPVLVVWAHLALLGAGTAGILLGLRGTVTELTVPGSLAFGATVTLVGWGFAALSALWCQLARDLSQARGWCFATFGVLLGLRVLADEREGLAWLRWVTPIGWRDLVRPFSEDAWAPVAVCLLASALVLGVAGVLYGRREYLAGYLPDRATSRRRWRVRGLADLWWRLAGRGLAGWGTGIAACGVLFGSMTGSFADLLVPGSPTRDWIDQVTGGSAVRQMMALMTAITMLLVASAAVRRVGTLAREERNGLLELELACGVSRSRRYGVHASGTILEGLVLAGLAAGGLAWATSTQLTTDHAVERAVVLTVTQLPGVWAATGLAMAVVGWAPRLASLSWAVIAWSGFAQLLGGLVKLPQWAQDLAVVGHTVDVVGDPHWAPLAVQSAVAVTTLLLGWAGFRRRDCA